MEKNQALFQKVMREHLRNCFVAEILTEFPCREVERRVFPPNSLVARGVERRVIPPSSLVERSREG